MEVKPGYKQTEVGAIPENWELTPFVSLGSVIDGDRGTNYPGSRDFGSAGYCLFLNAGNVTKAGFRFSECAFISREKDERLSKGKLNRDDIVLTTRGTVGNFAHFDSAVPFEHIRINSGMVILRKDSAALETKFLYALLQSHFVEKQIERLTFGSAQPQLTVKGISKFAIVVPPLPEQRAIAEALSDVDALLGALDRLIAKKRDLKQAAMQQLLTGLTRLPGFHGGWEVKRFGEIAQPRKERIDPRRAGVQQFCVELEHIEQRTGGLIGSTETDSQSSLKSLFRANDVLFGKLRAYLRKYWLAERDGVCSTEIWALVANRKLVTPKFLFQLVTVDRFIEAASMAYGTHMPRSDWNVVKNYEVAILSPDEQTAIAEVLSDLDAELAALERRRDKTRALKQGMMQELLTGRIRLIN